MGSARPRRPGTCHTQGLADCFGGAGGGLPCTEGGQSFARSIMAEAISTDATEIEMAVPMISGRAPAQSIYDKGAEAIAAHLDAGRDVAVLCEGDPLFYGSFMYILARLRDRFETRIIPGVTSMTACAAAITMRCWRAMIFSRCCRARLMMPRWRHGWGNVMLLLS